MNAPGKALASVSDMRVLVVDDSPADTALAARILVRAGMEDVMQVQDPTMVEHVLRDHEPDLVLLDLRMPRMDGFAVLEVIRRHAAGTYLPVIVVTVDNTGESVERAFDAGAHDYVQKPFNASELARRVRNALQNRRAYLELRRSRALLRTRLELFEPDLVGEEREPGEVRTLLQRAIDGNSIEIALQPVADMRDGTVIAEEALSRFPDSPLGGPAGWFAAALDLGLLVELELATLTRAIEVAEARPVRGRLAVNLSPSTLPAAVRTLEDMKVAWDRLTIELTEHVPIEDYDAVNVLLDPLRTAGAHVSVDDTGAGFASLRHILDLRPDVIKVDIGITRGVDVDPSRLALVEMLIAFTNRIGCTLVAEGVETESERQTLLGLGVIYGQGYLLGRPEIVSR